LSLQKIANPDDADATILRHFHLHTLSSIIKMSEETELQYFLF